TSPTCASWKRWNRGRTRSCPACSTRRWSRSTAATSRSCARSPDRSPAKRPDGTPASRTCIRRRPDPIESGPGQQPDAHMNQDALKRAAAEAALSTLHPGEIVGVGTGSTVNHFIDLLAGIRDRVPAAVSSSQASTDRLLAHGIRVLDLNEVIAAGRSIPVYVDGADEIDASLAMIKGGGGALTREKILAAAAASFVCIVDRSKCVERLGRFPLPIEVVPMAREL